jgi:hypothetical protein
MNSNDIELLRRYVFERSEAVFADLVRQHIALVYAAALRQTNGDAPLAEDVTQVVFTRNYGIPGLFVATGDALVRITSTATLRRPSVRHGSPPPFFPASC